MRFPVYSLALLSALTANPLAAKPLRAAVDAVALPLIQKNNLPGLAIAITLNGKRSFFNYGVASTESKETITSQTLFEIGSVSKTFAATAASYARITRHLSLSGRVSDYLPALLGTPFDRVTLLNLATHTSGLPLFVPDAVQTTDQLVQFCRKWRPAHPPGAYRTYSNIGIGLLGLIASKCMHLDYDTLIDKEILPALGMTHSYINIPPSRMKDYAQGYTAKSEPIRMHPGVLSSEAYGVKSCTADMIQFVEANLGEAPLNPKLLQAVIETHRGYFSCGGFIQDLVWEQYVYPVSLAPLLKGNAPEVIYHEIVAERARPTRRPAATVWVNKTGSTNGFSAYVAFVPAKNLGIVLLANKSYPIPDRVTAAYKILSNVTESKTR